MFQELTLSYTNKRAGIRMDDDSPAYTHEETLALARGPIHPGGGSLITELPSGNGLDFDVNEDKTIWLQFIADDGYHLATVALPTAEQVFERAYILLSGAATKSSFADLIHDWDFASRGTNIA